MRLALLQSLTCEVCDQNLDDRRRHTTRIATKLFGAAAYAVCPCCGQEVAPQHQTGAYRRRAREHLAGERPAERPGLTLYARRGKDGFQWVYREARRR